ncbi:MAG: hypothetical protein KF819_37025, partial [Labilithrix sp.]|nr:hypothetical protein [Labilithrix sp.]
MAKYKGRNFVANLMASVLIIGWGLVGCLFLLMVMSPNDYKGLTTAILLFGAIALIPLSGMRRSSDAQGFAMVPFLLALLRRKGRSRMATRSTSTFERRYWKRQRNSFMPEPFG